MLIYSCDETNLMDVRVLDIATPVDDEYCCHGPIIITILWVSSKVKMFEMKLLDSLSKVIKINK